LIVSQNGSVAGTGAVTRLLSAALEQFRSLRARHIRLDTGDVTGFWNAVKQVRPAVVVLLEPGEFALFAGVLASRPNADGPIVISGQDASSISVTAAALIAVNRRREATGTARVLLAGADRLPGLSALLALANVGELTIWNSADAASFSLRSVAAGVDVVINALGSGTDRSGFTAQPAVGGHDGERRRSAPVVVEPDWLADPVLVLPGLVHTLVTVKCSGLVTDLSRLDLRYHDVCFACALELVMATPYDQAQLPRPSHALSARLADAAARALAVAPCDPSALRPHPPAGRDHDW
jgi:malate dehydrogenase (oxaloacetate-decarboxylating)